MIYGVTIKNKLFEGTELMKGNTFLRSIETSDGDVIVIPLGYKVFDTAEERNIALFKKKKNQLSISSVASVYNISIEEATKAYEQALERFPEKFI